MTKLHFCLVLLCVNLIVKNEAARILGVFPFPSLSHQVVFRPLVQELVRRGHEVVVITPDPAFPKGQTPSNLTEIDIHDKSYKIWRDNIVSKRKKSDDFVDHVQEMFNAMNSIFDSQFQDKGILDLVKDKSKQFDLLLIEAYVRPALIFSHIYKVPTILISSLPALNYHYELIGMPQHPILYPSITRQKLYNLSIWEKVTELYNDYRIQRVIANNEEIVNDMMKRRIGPLMPKLSELYKNVHMLFLNIHPIFEGVRPTPPSVVYMGGIHQKEDKALPQDLKSYLDSSKHGIIYVSFGTNVDPATFPPVKIQILIKAFSQLPYDVLWKWNQDELPGRSGNIKISKWLPQSDLLKHRNVKTFITQGGLQSTDEAITAGVPLIGIPVLGDQWFNVEHYVHHQIGVRLDLETINEAKLTGAIKAVIHDESYRTNIIKLRTLIKDQPNTPLERAVWWTEYVIRNGGAKHLKPPSANMTWWEYLELKLVFTILGILLTIIAFTIIILYKLTKFIVTKFMIREKSKIL